MRSEGIGAIGSEASDIEKLLGPRGIDSKKGGGPIGATEAKKIVKLLDKTGFLDKIVEGIVSQSGMASWVNDGQRYSLKFELGEELANRFSDMNWAEVFEFVLELSIQIKSKTLGPMELDPENPPDTVYDGLEQTMKRHLEDITVKVVGAADNVDIVEGGID